MYCIGCGHEVLPGVKFCAACGTLAPMQTAVLGMPAVPASDVGLRAGGYLLDGIDPRDPSGAARFHPYTRTNHGRICSVPLLAPPGHLGFQLREAGLGAESRQEGRFAVGSQRT